MDWNYVLSAALPLVGMIAVIAIAIVLMARVLRHR